MNKGAIYPRDKLNSYVRARVLRLLPIFARDLQFRNSLTPFPRKERISSLIFLIVKLQNASR